MGKIKLPRTQIEDASDGVIVRHIQSGVTVSVSKRKLDTWAIAQLRSMISAPVTPSIIPATRKV
jgi:hypothetical protein